MAPLPVYYRLFDNNGTVNAQCKDANTVAPEMGVIDLDTLPPTSRSTFGNVKAAIESHEGLPQVFPATGVEVYTPTSNSTLVLQSDFAPFPPFVGTLQYPLSIQIHRVIPSRPVVTPSTSATSSTAPPPTPQPTPTPQTPTPLAVPAGPPPPYIPPKPSNDPTKFTGITWTCSMPSTLKHVPVLSDATMTFKPSGNSIDSGTLTLVFTADPKRKKKAPDSLPVARRYTLSQVSFKSPTVIEYTCKGITTNEHWTLSASLSADGTTLTVTQVQAFGKTGDTKTRLFIS